MIVTQLNPPIELNTPKGNALCHFLVYDGVEVTPLWGCFQEDGQIWWWPNRDVRAIRNFSAERPSPEKPKPMPDLDRYKDATDYRTPPPTRLQPEMHGLSINL